MKKNKIKQIFAIVAIVLLTGLYIACLVFALIKSPLATKLLGLTLVLTIMIPVILYVIMMFYKLSHRE